MKKFDAWDFDNDVMIEGIGITPDGLAYSIPNYGESFDQFDYYPNAKILQHTGLKDKHGTRIVEGDVYHQGDPRITYTVVWHDSGFIGKQNGSSSYAGLSHWQERIEVVGNIYENPELLEVRN